jgi:hypothetical protein
MVAISWFVMRAAEALLGEVIGPIGSSHGTPYGAPFAVYPAMKAKFSSES